MTYDKLRVTPGLRGVWALVRHYYRRNRSARDLAEEMYFRMHPMERRAEQASRWERWQLERFHLQLGRHMSTISAQDVFREYYQLKSAMAFSEHDDSDTDPSGEADELPQSNAPGLRSRMSALAEMTALTFIEPATQTTAGTQ
jgi:hypothetical protein